jgi:heptosyltransferase-2
VVLWLKADAAYQPPLDCAPCFERECPLGHTRCLNDIGADRVLAALAPTS